MKTINKLKKQLNCNITKYTLYNNIKYIETDKGNYIIKRKNNNDIYNYLNKNGYDNYINPIFEIDEYNIYPYLDDISVEDNEKALSIINLMSKLHAKTAYYKDISLEEIKDIYEYKKIKIKELNDYYDYLRFIIEEKDYPKPAELFLLKNISIIYICLDKVNIYLDKWYHISKTKTNIRNSLIHNNLEIDHLIQNDISYLISWEKSKHEIPIYDFINFYKKEFNKINFKELIKLYFNNIKITEDELYLLHIELLLPDKIIFEESEMKNIYNITYMINYLTSTYSLLLKDNEVNT
ncbi:MAG: hypothetical protein IJN90_03260 [Bacilli bacterium]|nr:hypothetical protein [Bacilli bacterium]